MKKKILISVGLLVFSSAVNAQDADVIWATGIGGSSNDYGFSVMQDGSGNVYTAGVFNGTVDFDPGAGTSNLTSNGVDDIFIQKLDVNGAFVWAKSVGGTGQDVGPSVALDPISSDVFLTGSFQSTVDFDPGAGVNNVTCVGTNDMFILRLDASGNFVGVQTIGSSSNSVGPAKLVFDATGNMYITGGYTGTIDFDPGAGVINLVSAGGGDVFIQKFNSGGTLVWAKSLGGSAADGSMSIDIDGSGNVITTGFFTGTADFNPGAGVNNLVSSGAEDVFVSKLDASGNYVWAVRWGSASNDMSSSIKVSSTGLIYIVGYFRTTVDFNPGAGVANLTSPTAFHSGYVNCINSSGVFQWVKGFLASGTDQSGLSSIDLDASDNIYVVGTFTGTNTLDLDPNAGIVNIVSSNGQGIVVKLDASGNFIFGSGYKMDYLLGIDVAADNEFAVTGISSNSGLVSTSSCLSSPMINNGLFDVIVVKFDQSTTSWPQTTKTSTQNDLTKDVIVDSDGNVYVTGYFIDQTTLEGGANADITMISGGVSGSTATYVAKYNACGDLEWESHSINSDNNVGNSIVLDELNGRVYVAGDSYNGVTFTQSSVPCGGSSVSVSNSDSRGFVGAFDMNTGCIIFIDQVSISNYTKCEAITINETSGRIYVAGSYSSSTPGTTYSSFVRSYDPTGSLGSAVGSLNTSGTLNIINDMDYYEASNTLWVVGNFNTSITLPGGTLNTTSGSNDAFCLKINDVFGTFTYGTQRRGGNTSFMSGEGISVESTEIIYLTGTYRSPVTNSFQVTGLAITNPTGSGSIKAYMIRIDFASTPNSWAKMATTSSSGGSSNGKSVTYRNGVAYFAGNFRGADLVTTGWGGVLAYVNSTMVPNSNDHCYVVAYDAAGSPVFRNASADPNSTVGAHTVESITIGLGGAAYMVGAYKNEFVVDQFIPSTANDLVSSGTGNNGFVLRVNSSLSGAFKSQVISDNLEIESNSISYSNLSIYPNPTTGFVTITINDFNNELEYSASLIGIDGRSVYNSKIIASQSEFDLSDLPAGIYVLNIFDGLSSSQIRVVKAN